MSKLRKTPAWRAPASEQPKITAHIERRLLARQSDIIDTLGAESIEVYRFLSGQYKKGALDKNPLFQFVYRSYYGLERAGLTDDFKTRYFELMERARVSGKIDLNAIAKDLRRFKAWRRYKTRKAVEVLPFSFITKLAATVDPNFPIYDRKVGSVFGFSPPDSTPDWNERLDRSLEFYEWLRALYHHLLSATTAPAAIVDLKKRYHHARTLPHMKALDFLFWQAGKLEIVAVP